ncbi:MAG TPA: hypothetical protein VK666_04225 [Chryseolinea sp.]|nr:hypothetical protein [Chryseolinea sp.]
MRKYFILREEYFTVRKIKAPGVYPSRGRLKLGVNVAACCKTKTRKTLLFLRFISTPYG